MLQSLIISVDAVRSEASKIKSVYLHHRAIARFLQCQQEVGSRGRELRGRKVAEEAEGEKTTVNSQLSTVNK